MHHQLVYISDQAPTTSDADVRDILRKSRANNQSRQITGILLHVTGHFLQVLEGDPELIWERFVVIRQDPRHQNCSLVHSKPVDARAFPDWSMGSRNLQPEAADGAALRTLRSAQDVAEIAANKSGVLQMWLEAFGSNHLNDEPHVTRASKQLARAFA